MFDPARLLIFLTASVVLILTPGPGVLYVIARSLSQGRRAGLASAAGLGVGNLTQTIAAALGLSAVLATSITVFSLVKYAGAAYLVFLGVKKMLSRTSVFAVARAGSESHGAIFRRGIMVGTLNPKTALFFLAFLPQFADATRGPITVQLLVLGLVFVVLGVVGDSIWGLLAGSIGSWLQRSAIFLRVERFVSGAIFCSLGVAAALSGASHKS